MYMTFLIAWAVLANYPVYPPVELILDREEETAVDLSREPSIEVVVPKELMAVIEEPAIEGMVPESVVSKVDVEHLMHKAVLEGNVDAVRFLCNEGLEADAVDADGKRPLTIALLHRDAESVTLLLKAGALVNPELSWGGMSPLTLSLSMKDLASARILLDRGAKVEAKDVLLCANLLQNEVSEEMLSFALELVEKAAHLSDRSDAVRRLAQNATQLALKGESTLLKALLAKGIDLNDAAFQETSPLMMAICAGNVELVELLVEAGADIHYDHSAPLKKALQEQRPEIVQYLTSKGK